MNEINELETSGAPDQREAELADNLASVRERVAEACRRSGRDPAEVTILAVSKTKPEADIMDLYRAGQRDGG